MITAISNPAPIYCENMGYTVYGADCVFEDSERCDAWEFYQGECGESYVNDLDCKELGETKNPGEECCEGLNPTTQSTEGQEGICGMIDGTFPVCLACGDEICDEENENKCNCPEDCLRPTEPDQCATVACVAPPICDEDEIKVEKERGICCIEYECEDIKDEDEMEDEEDETEIEYEYEDKNGTKMKIKAKMKKGIGEIIRKKVRAGKITLENGETIKVRELTRNRMAYLFGDDKIEVETELEVEEETENGTKRKIKVKLKNGRGAELKIMPEVASKRALERLRLKVCSIDNNCTIELKEVGKEREGNSTRLAYEMQIERHSRILGIFKTKMKVKAQIDAENGNVLDINKPWWAFIASEPLE